MVFEIVKEKCAFLVAGITAVVYYGYCFYNTVNCVKKDNVSNSFPIFVFKRWHIC